MKQIVLFIALINIFYCGFAQPKKVVADKIVAQVGDKIILRSEIINAIADYKRQGQDAQLPPHPECAFLEGQLIQKALVLQAEKDSLNVTEEEVDGMLENQIRQFVQAYGSKEALEEISGRTVYQLKDDFRASFRERKLADQMRSKIVDGIKITPNEVRAYFAKIPTDSLPFYESEVEVSHIISQPKANKDVEDYVIKQLYEYKRQVEAGTKKFEAIAKVVSEDPGSKENGGQYNLNRNESKQWDPAFFQAAFKLKEGQVSPVVKSKFGYHIIQMVSRSGDDIVVRHILRIPPITEEEIKLSVQKLDSVRLQLIAGTLPFGVAVEKYSDADDKKFTGGRLQGRDGSSYLTIDELDKDMVIAIKDLKVGAYSKPQVYEERGVKKVRVVLLKTRTTAHRESIKEDYNKIAQKALEEKKHQTLERWFKEHLPNYYITIDKDFADCSSLGDWWKYASNR
ncbi:MAG: peptidylprolyl isomerase [Chitinophagaceae bacterium]|nr:peptidylprolyl isomerase [Chitinophagaceae bacterium]